MQTQKELYNEFIAALGTERETACYLAFMRESKKDIRDSAPRRAKRGVK